MEEKRRKLQTSLSMDNKRFSIIKMYLPVWLLNISWLQNVFFSLYTLYKRKHKKYLLQYSGVLEETFAIDFVHYCLEQNVNFDTANFYSSQDEVYIKEHIDNRIKFVLSYPSQRMSLEQQRYFEQFRKMSSRVKKHRGYYALKHNDIQYYLPQNYYSLYVYDWHYGLKDLPDTVKTYIKGKDFLDVGAYIGDATIMFLQYHPSGIFSYEPVGNICKQLYKTMKINNLIGTDKVVIVKKGLGDKSDIMNIKIEDSCSSFLNTDATDAKTESVEISTIDIECKDRNVGLIKMDIEGFEYFALKGGLNTIKRDKPVLLISLYHTGRDFFEIPPLLKKCVPEYNFRIIDHKPFDAILEKILVAHI
jgi:FkbM family methyltransferase